MENLVNYCVIQKRRENQILLPLPRFEERCFWYIQTKNAPLLLLVFEKSFVCILVKKMKKVFTP